MARLLSLLVLVAVMAFLPGCATTDPANSGDSNRVSNIPWNRPEKWESQGPMGGMMNTR